MASELVPHQFKKGVSGNPAGRPKGSKNQLTLVKIEVEGALRAQMKPRMREVMDEILRQALPSVITDEKTGKETIIPGDKEMLKLLHKSWVSGTKASDDEPPKEKIQIVIGKLDQVPPVSGRVIQQET